jgi:hypothetical protein
MFRKLLRLSNPEIAFGFLIATLFWVGVLGWQAAYAPSEVEKRQCEETAHKSGHKTDECKSLWQRTTSDPVAFFTLWLVIFTAGLTVSTILLWRAGEKQARHTRRAFAVQSRDMRDSIVAAQRSADIAMLAAGSERAWLSMEKVNVASMESGTLDGVPFQKGIGFSIRWVNRGRSPAIRANSRVMQKVVKTEESDIAPRFEAQWVGYEGNIPIGPGDGTNSGSQTIVDDVVDALYASKVAIFLYAMTRYEDVFNRGVERKTEVCVRIRFRGHMVDRQTGLPEPIWFIEPMGPQNDAT